MFPNCGLTLLAPAKVVPEEITPLVPATPGEKVADDQTCYVLQTVLKFMVVQVSFSPCSITLHSFTRPFVSNPLASGCDVYMEDIQIDTCYAHCYHCICI